MKLYKYNESLEVSEKLYIGDYKEVAHQLYGDLYPKIWGLLNNNKYFRKSKKHGVLYAVKQAQHVFTIRGRSMCNNNGMLFPLMEKLFRQGRLKRYTQDFWCSMEAKKPSLQITPYVFVRLDHAHETNGMFWDYGVYGMGHTIGQNKLYRLSRVYDDDMFVSLPEKLTPGLGANPVDLYISMTHPDKFEIVFRDRGEIEINHGRFNMQVYRFMKYLERISYLLNRGASDADARSNTARWIQNYLSGLHCTKKSY